jgi:hypothetical protein
MSVRSHNIAAALAERLSEVAPPGISLRPYGAEIQVRQDERVVGSAPALEIIDDDDGRSLPDRLETAVRAALAGIQDVIMESLHDPWPEPSKLLGSPGGGADLPHPDSHVTGTELLAWFGDASDPVLSLRPIGFR